MFPFPSPPPFKAGGTPFVEDFESGAPPTGWTNTSNNSGDPDYTPGYVGSVTTNPFSGAKSIQLGNSTAGLQGRITRTIDTSGLTRAKMRVAGTSAADCTSRLFGTVAGTAIGPSGTTVSAINTAVAGPVGTWWEIVYALASPGVGSSVALACYGGSYVNIDKFELY